MCGICGFIGSKGTADADWAVRRMMAALTHRGPDDQGIAWAPSAAVGMRRLSIIDLEGGHQPVFNEHGDVAVVLNGEIYNFREIRQTLEAAGHCFRTKSDTEVVVHAYEQWDEDCLERLRGMFALAILDSRSNSGKHPRVFLARDRLGIKPLYYAVTDGALLFASEVRALLASTLLTARLSMSALKGYLLFGSVCEPTTLVEGIFSLPPGHSMSVLLEPEVFSSTAAHIGIRPKPYWDLAEAIMPARSSRVASTESAAQQIRLLLEDAVRMHLIADVPLGVFLSSGMDSTALAALASRKHPGIHTFTVAFTEQEFSEAQIARRTAERLGTRHQELVLTGEQLLARLEEAVAALDQPTMDGLNTYFVSWAARQVGLKVALSGLGADEIFGGYSTFRSTPRAARIASMGRVVPRAVRTAVASAFARFGRKDASRKLASLWKGDEALPHPYFYVRALFTPEQATALCAGSTSFEMNDLWPHWLQQSVRRAERLDEFTRVTYLEARSYMLNTLLRDTDAVSMSHSLEVRVPFLDHPLVEYMARLPEGIKRAGRGPKALLAESLEDVLPADVAAQRKRMFTFPWEQWLRGALGERVSASLKDLTPSLRSVLGSPAIEGVWRDFLERRTSWSRPWSLFVLNEWCRRHLEGSPVEVSTAPAVSVRHNQASLAAK